MDDLGLHNVAINVWIVSMTFLTMISQEQVVR